MSDHGGVWAWIAEGVRELLCRDAQPDPRSQIPTTYRDRDGIERPIRGCLGAFSVDEDGRIIR